MPILTPLSRLAVVLLAITAFSGAGSAPATAQDAYTVLDLGSFISTLPGIEECPHIYNGSISSINDDGVVAGRTPWDDRTSAAFRATDGKIKRLKSGKGGGIGLDINTGGQVVGFVTGERTGAPCSPEALAAPTDAASWVGGALELLPDRDQISSASTVNDDGVIVGTLASPITRADGAPGTVYLPIVWRDGEIEDLPLPIDGVASAVPSEINADGQIIGVLLDQDFGLLGSVLWEDGEATLLPDGFIARSINDDGVIVGTTDGATRAARLVAGELVPLPGIVDATTGVAILGMNADGDVVGFTQVANADGTTTYTSTLWRGGEAIDIATLTPEAADWASPLPLEINASGAIALNVTYTSGEQHGIILTPETT